MAAWVRVADASATRVAVSQARSPASGFSLGVRPDPDTGAPLFAFAHGNPDTTATVKEALVTVPAVMADWVHLTAVYRAPTQELTLYVNGESAASVNAPFVGEEAAGPFVIGRGFVGPDPAYFWSGDIDEVRTFNGSLDDDQVWWIANEPRPAP